MGGSMFDRSGWVATDCSTSDRVRRLADGVSSGFTNLLAPDPSRGPAVQYTEWHHDGAPSLRDYRWPFPRPCEHLVPEAQS